MVITWHDLCDIIGDYWCIISIILIIANLNGCYLSLAWEVFPDALILHNKTWTSSTAWPSAH